MKVKRNKALRTGARLMRPGAAWVPALAPPAAAAAARRLGSRAGAANSLAAAVAGILYCASGTAHAQNQATPAQTPDANSLSEIVVTASAYAGGVKMLDASYNIVSADASQIKMANPVSTADLLKISPGIWPESSGGETGANIEIAGVPGGGDAPYFTNMIEGSPLYGMPSLSFMDSSSFLRLDDTIQRVEVVQFGPGAIFGPGQMGATANFILRRGTDKPTGSVGLTYGSEGRERVDAFYGGKIADGWYGSAGGFYRRSKGVRSPQFPSDNGGQFTATISHNVDGGSFMFWVRELNDSNQFIVPLPLVQNGGSFSAYPGFNALTSSYGSHAIQYVNLPSPQGGFEGANLANGRGGDLHFLGFDYNVRFADGWSVVDHFLFDGGNLNTNALFSGPNPRPLSYYLYGCNTAEPAGYCNASNQPVDNNNLNGGAGYPTSQNISATYPGGATVPLTQSVIQQGWWYIQKRLENLTDELRVNKDIGGGHTLTGGVYFAHYTDDDNWSLGNQMIMTNTPNATPIQLSYVQGGNTYDLSSPQGFVSFNNNYNIVEHGDATNIAPYFGDSWKSDRWLVDASARLETIDAHQRTCNRTNQQLGTIYQLYENAVPSCNGTWDMEHYVKAKPAFTIGANYEISRHMSAYVRWNTGNHFDDFDNGIRGAGGNFAPLQTVKNYEGGFKWQTPLLYLDISVYHRQFTGLQYQETNATGVATGAISTFGSDSKGINFSGTVRPFKHFDVNVIGDYMDGHYTHFNGCAPYIDINGNNQCAPIDGAPLQRQPKFQISVTPSYMVLQNWGDVTGWITYEHVGQRYEDQSGLQPLGSYYMLSGGVVADVGDNWQFRLQGTNLTNQIGLTEGNARRFGYEVGINNVIMARPIQGREVNIEAKYKF